MVWATIMSSFFRHIRRPRAHANDIGCYGCVDKTLHFWDCIYTMAGRSLSRELLGVLDTFRGAVMPYRGSGMTEEARMFSAVASLGLRVA
jgi:hypothetical protein